MLVTLKRAWGSVLSVSLLALPLAAGAQWTGGGGARSGLGNSGSVGLPGGTVYNIISQTLAWLLGILGFIAIIGFVISGILYLTSAGNDSQAEQAKNAMKYSIIGVIVGLVGWVAVQAIDTLLMGVGANF